MENTLILLIYFNSIPITFRTKFLRIQFWKGVADTEKNATK